MIRLARLKASLRQGTEPGALHLGVHLALQELVQRQGPRGGQCRAEQGVDEPKGIYHDAHGSQDEAHEGRHQDHHDHPGLRQGQEDRNRNRGPDIWKNDDFRDGDKLNLRCGLNKGERVVTQGAYQLKLQELQPAEPGAHTHET